MPAFKVIYSKKIVRLKAWIESKPRRSRIHLSKAIFWIITEQIQEKEAEKHSNYKGTGNKLFFVIFFHRRKYMCLSLDQEWSIKTVTESTWRRKWILSLQSRLWSKNKKEKQWKTNQSLDKSPIKIKSLGTLTQQKGGNRNNEITK